MFHICYFLEHLLGVRAITEGRDAYTQMLRHTPAVNMYFFYYYSLSQGCVVSGVYVFVCVWIDR